LIDTHAHLDMAHFDQDRTDVIARARASGVTTIITVGIDLTSSRQALKLAEHYDEVMATVGIHPHNVIGVREQDVTQLAHLAEHPKVVAIGEAGLDFYRNRALRETQIQVLKWQLELATTLGLPVIIHCRQAESEMLSLLHQWVSSCKDAGETPPGVIHCFSGELETAQQYLDMSFLISLGAYIGYPTSVKLHSVIAGLPPDRIMLETDCPFLPPQSHRGKRNEPAYLAITAGLLAKIRKVPVDVIIRQTTENACRLFHFPPK
jgi:TatD DNase family protein